MKLRRLIHTLSVALGFLLFSLLSLLHIQQTTLAQSGDIVVRKALNQPGNVVRVGDVLSFTITVTNQSAFTLTNVTITDTFDSSILQFLQATPGEDSVAGDVIRWDNVAVLQNPAGMQVSDTLTLTLFFRAVQPREAIVNRVEGGDVIRGGSQAGSGASDETQPEPVIGGRAPVFKSLSPPGITPTSGLPLTFTQIITNDSGALLTQLALTDTYDANFLQFKTAFPFTPNITSPVGTLVWTNLASTTYFGPITADGTIVLTTVFTASGLVQNGINQAETGNALDEFSNDVTGDAFQVPITIIDNPDDAGGDDNDSTEQDRNRDDDDDDDDDDSSRDSGNVPAPTATPRPTAILVAAPTATPVETTVVAQATITDSTVPRVLPATGHIERRQPKAWLVIVVIALGGLGMFGVTRWWYARGEKRG